MSQLESFWQNLFMFILKYDQLSMFMLVLIIATLLWQKRPQDRKPVATTVVFFVIALCGLGFSNVLAMAGIKFLASSLREASIFTAGMAGVRLFGLLLFRLILPLCRISLLRILEDLAEFAGYCAWLMVYLHTAGLNLSGIVTTSAIMTAVLAFSMQETLGNIFGGLALQLDSSIKVGDWIKVDDINGRVTDIRWRYTAVETRTWETIIIPNSSLMKSKFSVLGRRTGKPLQWRRCIYFDVGYEHSSGHIINIVQNAVRHGNIANVADTPQANCLLMDFKASTTHYGLRYWLTDIEWDDITDSEVRCRIYAALQREGIKLPYPQYHIHLTNKDDQYEQNQRLHRIKERMDTLQQVDLFNTLHDEELAEIAEHLVYTPFAQGDIIMRQGAIANWLYIIKSGTADVFLELSNGGRRQIETIYDGCFIGEMGLMTGDPRSATVIAKSEVLAYQLDKETFQKVLDKRPELAVEISKLLVNRRFSIDNLQQQLDSDAIAQMLAQQQKNFLEQIRTFFGLGNSSKPASISLERPQKMANPK